MEHEEHARLAAAIEANEVAFARTLAARTLDAEWRDETADGRSIFWALTDAHEVGVHDVLRTRLDAAAVNPAIAEVLGRFQARGVPCTWWVFPSTRPLDLGDTLIAVGFTYRGEGPGMGRDLRDLPMLDAVPGLSIARVVDEARMAAWLAVTHADEARPQPPAASEVALACQVLFAPESRCALFLGTLEGRPVATSMSYGAHGEDGSSGDVATIAWVITAPEARRRGIGAALTLAALGAAREDGHRAAVLMASPMGAPVYRRLGFTEVCRIRSYRWVSDG